MKKRALSCTSFAAAALLAAAAFATSAAAATVTIGFQTPGMTSAARGSLTVAVTARSESGAVAEATLPLAKGGTIGLAPGLWELAPTVPGFWSQPSTIRVAGDTAATLTLFPAATIRGTVVSAEKPPRLLTIYFQPAPAEHAEAILPFSSVECPISGKRWTCEVPAGALDLAIRAPGYVSIYRWNEPLSHTAPRDLGALTLRRGSTVSGSAFFAERLTNPPKITVTLASDATAPQTLDRKNRDRLLRQTATPNARGFFALTAAPGIYTIQAAAGELISEPRTVRVLDGREMMLREPLLLERPRVFTLQVVPALDPLKKPWSVLLQKMDRNHVVESDVAATIPPSGRWQTASLTPGRYALSIRRTPSDSWHYEEFDLAADETREINLHLGAVKGTVTLGGKPLKGTVWFGGEHGQPHVPILTHEDGTFAVLLPLPDDAKWPVVDVTAETPYVHRTVNNVQLQRHEGKPWTVEIDVPSTLLLGEVVDAAGAVKRSAIINVAAADGSEQQILSDDGSFSISGLPAGRTALRAETREDESDGPQEVDVRADDSTTVRLVVKPRSVFDGTVTSTNGPVGSAIISALPLDFRYRNVGRFPVEEDGHFTMPLPPGTTDSHLFVSAPGYAFRMMRAQKPEAGPLLVLLDSQGGSLIVEAPRRDAGELLPVVLHNGAAMPALTLAWLADGTSGPNGEHGFRATCPLIEEGSYAACWMPLAAAGNGVPNGRCVNGLVARGGTLTLTLPEP